MNRVVPALKPAGVFLFSALLALSPMGTSAGLLDGVLSEIKNQAPNILQPKKGRQQQANDGTPAGVNQAADVAGILGLAVCTKSNNKANRLGMCAIGAVLAAEMTRQLGTRIADGLRESEQRQVLAAAADSLKTGEPNTVELPESGQQVVVGPSGAEALRDVRVELVVDQTVDVPKIRVLGEAQESRGSLKVRSGPAASAHSVGTLRSGETVHAIGQVGNATLVSRWAMENGAPRPVGTGYVDTSGLAPSTKKDFPGESDLMKNTPVTKTITVDAVLKCRSLDFKKRDASGNTVQDKSYLCIGPDGSTRSA